MISLLVIVFSLTSCVEEPTVPPVKRPYSVLRIGNLSSVNSMDVYIDGVKSFSNLAQNKFTAYFDIKSGKRQIVVKPAGGSNVLLNKSVDIVSYENITMCFGGYYSPSIDTSSFAVFTVSDGFVYQKTAPSADSLLLLYAINGTGDYPTADFTETDTSKAYTLNAVWHQITSQVQKIQDTTIVGTDTTFSTHDSTVYDTTNVAFDELFSGLKFGSRLPAEIPEGWYSFKVVNTTEDQVATFDATFNAGTRTYIYFSGTPSAPVVTIDEQSVLPVRSK